MTERGNQLPGKRVSDIWPWLHRIDKITGKSRLDQDTRKRKVKRAEQRRWRREVDGAFDTLIV